jgi:hypothetical protein
MPSSMVASHEEQNTGAAQDALPVLHAKPRAWVTAVLVCWLCRFGLLQATSAAMRRAAGVLWRSLTRHT